MAKYFLATVALTAILFALPALADVTIQQTEEGLTVELDGKPFAKYVKESGNKPIIWPIVGPTGKEMMRQFPMRDAGEGEKADHPHHRSFWFTHGDVNGISFWHEGNNTGTIKNREISDVSSGKTASFTTVNDWISPDGQKICEEHSTYTFGGDADSRWIDAVCTIRATEDKDVVFGDTKEGSFGVRVAGTMKVDSKPGGTIVNSEGQTDKDAWGKAASWVDYHGPIEGETLGIAILNHPDSFRYPTYWHVRTYGLFAANPFGLSDFKVGKKGTHTLKQGDTMTLRHRVIFHKGDEKDAAVAKAFEAYAKEK